MKALLLFLFLFNFGFSEEHLEDIQLSKLKIELIETQEEKRKTFNELAQGYKYVSEYYSRHEDNSTIEEEIQVLTGLLDTDKAALSSIRQREEILKKMIAHKKTGDKNGR